MINRVRIAFRGHYGCDSDGRGDVGKALEGGSMTSTLEKIDEGSDLYAIPESRKILSDSRDYQTPWPLGACLLKGSLVHYWLLKRDAHAISRSTERAGKGALGSVSED